MAVDKMILERRQAILEGAFPYLNIPSPFSIWDPSEMKFNLADGTPLRGANELEGLYYQGFITKSDMFYLKAVHAFGFCTRKSMQKLMVYWKERENKKAYEEKRQPLAIPDATEAEAYKMRFGMLKKYGMVCCHSFYTRGGYTKKGVDKRLIYMVPGLATSIYKAVLEDSSYLYDSRMPFMSETEILRRVQNSILSAAFLDSPFLTSAKFNYLYRYGKEKINFLCYLSMAQDGVSENPYRLILDSVTLRVNENIIRRSERESTVRERLRDLLKALRNERDHGERCYLVLCAEDAEGIVFIQKTIYSIDAELLSYVLVTTGTLLEMFEVLKESDNLGKCFFEFDREDRYKLVGATGFYFLPWRDGK